MLKLAARSFVARSMVPLTLCLTACGDPTEAGPPGYAANKSKIWAAEELPTGELFAFAGSAVKASAKTPDGAFANGVAIGTIAPNGSFKITIPKEFPYSNGASGLRTYCTSGLDFEFRTGYACYSQGQDDAHRQRNACTFAPESQVQNIRLAARPAMGESRSATTVAALSESTTFPYAIVVLDHDTEINGCSNCLYQDESTGLTSTGYTFVCYESEMLPANTLLGVFRANGPHQADQTLAVRIRPLTAADLKYLAISGAP